MVPLSPRFPCVRKIAVLRANALGDFIFCLPALDALRTAYPHAEIVYLGASWHRDFLMGRPGPWDRVEAVPPYGGVSVPEGAPLDEEAMEEFFQTMRAEYFDLAIQMHGGGRNSNPFILRLGAAHTVGTATPDAIRPERDVPYDVYQHEILRCLEVAAAAGAPPVTLDPVLTVTASDRAEAERRVPDDGRPLVVIHPGVSSVDRRWPAEKFAAVGDGLVEAGARVVVTGTAGEAETVERVVAAMQYEGENLSGEFSLGGLTGLLSRARLLVTNDTGPIHLARALATPTVGVYWCFNLMVAGPFWRTHHREVVSWRLDCPTCGRSQAGDACHHTVSYVADVPVERVLVEALDLFARDAARTSPSVN